MEGNFPKKNYYRVDEVAKYFAVSRRTVYRLIKEGKITPLKIYHSTRISCKELMKLEKKRRI